MFLLSVKSLCRCRKTPCPNLWSDRTNQNKDLFSSNCMSDMCLLVQ